MQETASGFHDYIAFGIIQSMILLASARLISSEFALITDSDDPGQAILSCEWSQVKFYCQGNVTSLIQL